MDNQTTRQPAAPAMRSRATFADADTNTGEIALRFGSDTRNVTVGGDVEMIDKDVTITNPINASFFLKPNRNCLRNASAASFSGVAASEPPSAKRL